MHYLTRQRLHIARFHPLMKVLLSLYIVSVLAAMWVATLKYTDRGEWSFGGVREFIAGSADTSHDPFGDPMGGTEEGLAYAEPKSRRELVDIVHPHLFSIPIVLFLLGHLVHLTGLRDGLKLAINVTAFGSFLVTFLLPFAVVTRPGLTPVLVVSGSVFVASCVVLCLVPFCSMWWGNPERGFDAIPARRTSDD